MKIAAVVVVLGLWAGTAEAAGRFVNQGYASYQPAQQVCYPPSQWVIDEQNYYDQQCQQSGIYDPWGSPTWQCQEAQDHCNYNQGWWSWDHCELNQICYTEQAYFVGPQYGDILLWEGGESAGMLTMLQVLAFPQVPRATLKTHAAVCSSGYGGQCSQIWQNNTTYDLGSAMSAVNSCGGADTFKNNLAYTLSAMNPGLHWASAPGGRVVYFRTGDQSAIDTFSSNSYNNLGPNYGGPYRYNIGGYSSYQPYSQCSESVSDAYGLSAVEGGRTSYWPGSTAYNLQFTFRDAMFNICRYGSWNGYYLPNWNGISSSASWCWSQGGRDGICTAVANAFVNAVMARPWMGTSWSPSYSDVYGLTSPEDMFQHLRL